MARAFYSPISAYDMASGMYGAPAPRSGESWGNGPYDSPQRDVDLGMGIGRDDFRGTTVDPDDVMRKLTMAMRGGTPPPPVVGEHVGYIPSDAPANRWNSTAFRYRGWLCKSVFVLMLLYYAFILAFALYELSRSNYDHAWSINDWWWWTLVFMLVGFLDVCLSIFLHVKKMPLDRKAEQNWPPPPQDWKVILVGFMLTIPTFVLVAWLDAESNPTDIEIDNIYRDWCAIAWGASIVFLLNTILTLRIPCSLPRPAA